MYDFNLRNGNSITDKDFDLVSNNLIETIKNNINLRKQKLFGYPNNRDCFINNSENELNMLEWIDLSKNPKILIVDDVCLKSAYEFNKINYNNYVIGITNTNYLNHMRKLPYKCLSQLVKDGKINLLSNLDLTEFNYILSLTAIDTFKNGLIISIQYHQSIKSIKMNRPHIHKLSTNLVGTASAIYKVEFNPQSIENIDNDKELLNSDFRKIYEKNCILDSKNKLIDFDTHTYNENLNNLKTDKRKRIYISYDTHKAINFNTLYKNDVDITKKTNASRLYEIRFSNDLVYNNFKSFTINHNLQKVIITNAPVFNPLWLLSKVDWTKNQSTYSVLKAYNYSDIEINKLIIKYSLD